MTPRLHMLTYRAAATAMALQAAWLSPAHALETPRQDFSLGQSAHSGAVCAADRVWNDPLGFSPGARAWTVSCRGWTQALGHLYRLPDDTAAKTWDATLLQRAACTPPRPAPGPVAAAQLRDCKLKGSDVAYQAYTVRRGGRTLVAEGFAPIADVLQTGLAVIDGRKDPPRATQAQEGGGSAVGDLAGMTASTAGAASSSLEHLREDAYREGQAYQFGQAEVGFQQILADNSGSSRAQAEAALNLALNVSNTGRFREADRDFAAADERIARAGSPRTLTALALNYKAAHARNQRSFAQAVAFARDAIHTRARTDRTPSLQQEDGAVVIGSAEAAALSGSGQGFASGQLRANQIEAVRDAQALQIEGTSLQALGEILAARQALLQGAAILDRGGLDRAAPWLTSRLQADIAELDLDTGQIRPALTRMDAAVNRYRRLYPGSLGEGRLLLELAQMQGRAAKTEPALSEQSLANYEEALDIFRRERGALGGSADLAGGFFETLLHRIDDAPSAHRQAVERFFNASQAVVSEAAAQAAAQFAARISHGDGASAGISRARDDVRRQIDITQGQLDTLRADLRQRQAARNQTPAAQAKEDAEAAALTASLADLNGQAVKLEQELLAANPRYGAVLESRVTLDELQRSLKPGEAYVKILLLPERGYGMFITSTQAKPYVVDLTREDADALVSKIRKPFDDVARTGLLTSYNVAAANQLFDKLFGPVRSDLFAARSLIYEPDAALIGAPAAALVTDPASVALMSERLKTARRTHRPLHYDGVAFLGARMASSVAVSASSFWQVRRLGVQLGASRAPKPFLGFGDPLVSDSPREFASVLGARGDACAAVRQALLQLPPVPGAAQEVRTIGAQLGASSKDMVLGPEFTDSSVMAEGRKAGGLDQYRVLYFATHGLLPLPNGCLKPSLVTSLGPAPSDGLLDMDDIFDLKLDAELVVLAACDTGRAAGETAGQTAVNGGGEALGGLVRAFIYAGARNLVVSNWEADSEATEALMTGMFSRAGETQADALRDAQLQMMRSDGVRSHPGYWAAFTIVGDGANPMPGAGSPAAGGSSRVASAKLEATP